MITAEIIIVCLFVLVLVMAAITGHLVKTNASKDEIIIQLMSRNQELKKYIKDNGLI